VLPSPDFNYFNQQKIMKQQNNTTRIAGIIALSLITSGIFTSCKKSTSAPATGTFYFHIHTNIDTSEVDDAAALYRDATGRHFGLSEAQFYISSITLHSATGSTYTFPDTYVLKNIDSEQYLVGTAPIGTYTSVSFNVGLDAATNATTPTTHGAGTPLANSDMWYGTTTQGYKFLLIKGFADTTTGQTGTNLVHFSYAVGSSANLKVVNMPTRSGSLAPYVLTKDGNEYIHMICDYGALLSVINFKTQDSTDTYTADPATATAIANNIPAMFSYEE
jgi:hypothetical protein